MKRHLSAATAIAGIVLLAACHPKQTETTLQQEQIIQQQQAREERELHEREAALDEQQRLLEQRQNGQLTVAPENAQPQQPAQAPGQQPPQPQEANAPASTPDVTYQQFYDYLSPYGSWIQMAGYGYVWQPSATVRDNHWRPYTLGRWAYTDDGWTWISDEPFGWITYHYGRWMMTHTEGWVWMPGDQWAPAWVSWRYGNDFVGWAPLPPEARFDGSAGIQQWADQQYNLGATDYVFVPASEFGDTSMLADEVPPDQVPPIYDESTNDTNIYEDGGVIYCLGPSYEFLRSKCHGTFPGRLKLVRVDYNKTGTNGVFESNGTLNFTAPRVVASRRAEAPTSIRDHGVVDARVVSPASTPPPHGAPLPPLYRPPQVVKEEAARDAQQRKQPQGQQQTQQQAPPPPGVAEVVETQNGRDQQIIQRNQESQQAQRQREEAQQQQPIANQAQQKHEGYEGAEQQAARNQQATDDAARAARQQAEQQAEAARAEAIRQQQQSAPRPVQTIPAGGTVPAGPVIPGRQQQ